MSLLEDLAQAEMEAAHKVLCGLCAVIDSMADEGDREALRGAAAGTIGVLGLMRVLTKNELTNPYTGEPIARRTIERHRTEEHS